MHVEEDEAAEGPKDLVTLVAISPFESGKITLSESNSRRLLYCLTTKLNA